MFHLFFNTLILNICKQKELRPISKRSVEVNCPVKSSRRRGSVKKGVLRNVATFTEKHLCRSLFFNILSVFVEHLQMAASVLEPFPELYECQSFLNFNFLREEFVPCLQSEVCSLSSERSLFLAKCIILGTKSMNNDHLYCPSFKSFACYL